MWLASGLHNLTFFLNIRLISRIYPDYIIHRLILNEKRVSNFINLKNTWIHKQLSDYVWNWKKKEKNDIFTFSIMLMIVEELTKKKEKKWYFYI